MSTLSMPPPKLTQQLQQAHAQKLALLKDNMALTAMLEFTQQRLAAQVPPGQVSSASMPEAATAGPSSWTWPQSTASVGVHPPLGLPQSADPPALPPTLPGDEFVGGRGALQKGEPTFSLMLGDQSTHVNDDVIPLDLL